MKAVVYHKYGSPSHLKLVDIPKPVPGDHEVLIKICAASVNSWDWDLLRGRPFAVRLDGGLFKPKRILGCDVAGRIEAVGQKVQDWKPGDEVFGDISGSGWGGFAEFVCAPAKILAERPENMTFQQAAALPQAGILALQGLRKGQLTSGQHILINGAGGGVGTIALQIARAKGTEVTCVDSAEKMEFLRSLGADHVIDYRQTDFTENGKRYDLILDVMAYHSLGDYARALRPGGRFVMAGGSMRLIAKVFFLGRFVSRSKKLCILVHRPNRQDLEELGSLFQAGTITPVIDKQYSLEEVPEALAYLGGGHSRGKLVINIGQ
jgi:NADPH:quinone reductase-like Zn-dependent oxidoreductase